MAVNPDLSKRRNTLSHLEIAKKETQKLDVLVIGAGFAGLAMLHKLQNNLGLNVRLIDKATGVGGTWYLIAIRARALTPKAGFIATASIRSSMANGSGRKGILARPKSAPIWNMSRIASTYART